MARKIDTWETLNDELAEREWQLHRRFMREVEREVDCHFPVEVLLGCENVALKWAEYVSKN